MAIRPPLWEFVFLSMLLHALAIALFGAPSGGSREGRAMWGSLQVVLQGAAPESAPGLRIERRLEGVPAARARPSREASRARPERTRPTPAAPAPAAKIEAPRVEAPKVDAPSVAPDAAPRDTPFVVPPLLDRVKPAEPDVEMVPLPDVPIPPQTPIATPAEEPAPRLAAPPPTPEPATVAAPVIEPPAVVPPVTVQPPAVERAPIDAPKIQVPIAQPAEPPLPPPTPAPTPPTSSAPLEVPALPVPNATPPVAQPPVELPALPVPETRSATPPAPVAPKMPVEAAPELPSSVPLPPPAAAIETPPRRQSAMPPESAASPGRSPDLAPAPKREGNESLFKRDAPPGDYDPTRPAAPSLDLDAVRKRAGELGREGSGQRALLAFPMPPVPPRKSKMETAIENARKPDCRTAYQGLGLAAAIPLIANEFGEGSCRW